MLHFFLNFSGVDGTVPGVNALSKTESDSLTDVNKLLLKLKSPLLEIAILEGSIVFA